MTEILYSEAFNLDRLRELITEPMWQFLYREASSRFKERPLETESLEFEKEPHYKIIRRNLIQTYKLLEKDFDRGIGLLKVKYYPSKSNPEGRVYSRIPDDSQENGYIPNVKLGYQGLPGWIRSYCGGQEFCFDIDMDNAYPCIMRFLTNKWGISEDRIRPLVEYIDNREPFLRAEMDSHDGKEPGSWKMSRSDAKTIFLITMHMGNPENTFPKYNPSDKLKSFRKTLEWIVDQMIKRDPEGFTEVSKIATSLGKSARGSYLSRVLQKEENEILQNKLVPFLESYGYQVGSLVFDGCMIYKGENQTTFPDKLLKLYSRDVNLPEYMKISCKEMKDMGPILNKLRIKYRKMENEYTQKDDLKLGDKVADNIYDTVRTYQDTIEGKWRFHKYNKKIFVWEKTTQDDVLRIAMENMTPIYDEMLEYMNWIVSENPNIMETLMSQIMEHMNEKIRKEIDKMDNKGKGHKDRQKVKEGMLSQVPERLKKNVEMFWSLKNEMKEMEFRIGYIREHILIKTLKTTTGMNRVLTMAKSSRKLKIDKFEERMDSVPYYLPLSSGLTVDLRSGELKDTSMLNSEDIFFTKYSKAKKLGDAKKMDGYIKAHFTPDDEDRKYLQTQLGFCLTGEPLDRNLFIWLGEGGNGKSILMSLVRGINPYTCTLPWQEIISISGNDQTRKGSEHTTSLIPLKYSRMATIPEPPKGAHFISEKIKILTGGDIISARDLNQKSLGSEFTNTCKLIIYTNELLGSDNDNAMTDRIKYLKFPYRYVDQLSGDGELQILKTNEDFKEMVNNDDLLAWLVEGSVRFYKEGLITAKSTQNTMDELMKDSDPLREYMELNYFEMTGSNVKITEIINGMKYADKCLQAYTSKKLASALRKIYGDENIKKGHGGVLYAYGIKRNL